MVVVDSKAACTEEINNQKTTGAVRYTGRTWNAKSSDSNVVIHAEERVIIVDWEGYRMIVKSLKKFFNWMPKPPPMP